MRRKARTQGRVLSVRGVQGGGSAHRSWRRTAAPSKAAGALLMLGLMHRMKRADTRVRRCTSSLSSAAKRVPTVLRLVARSAAALAGCAAVSCSLVASMAPPPCATALPRLSSSAPSPLPPARPPSSPPSEASSAAASGSAAAWLEAAGASPTASAPLSGAADAAASLAVSSATLVSSGQLDEHRSDCTSPRTTPRAFSSQPDARYSTSPA